MESPPMIVGVIFGTIAVFLAILLIWDTRKANRMKMAMDGHKRWYSKRSGEVELLRWEHPCVVVLQDGAEKKMLLDIFASRYIPLADNPD